MNHIGLFEGIGGFSLAARWMGWETIAWCEWNEFCQKVLSYHFPKANKHGDIKQTDFTIYRGLIDILTGGFPCQPYSVAGKRLGKEDERHLWPEMLRAIREIQPRWIVGENVHGIVNWNGGLVFNEVQADLEAEGYEVQAFILPACAVNAPHRRDRVWFIAHRSNAGVKSMQPRRKDGIHGFETTANSPSLRPCRYDWKRSQRQQFRSWRQACHIVNGNGWKRISTDTNSKGLQERIQPRFGSICSQATTLQGCKPSRAYTENQWREFPTVSPLCNGNDGLSDRLDGITFSNWRQESIKAGGNAVVPQVVYQIFKAIEQYESLTN